MASSSQAPEPDDYDYPTEPIGSPSPQSPSPQSASPQPPSPQPPSPQPPSPQPASPQSETSRGADSATVLASTGAAAIVAALVLTVGITGMLLVQDRTPATAAPATVVQLGQAAPVTSSGTTTVDTAAPSQSTPAAEAPPAEGPVPAVPADSPAATSTPSARAAQSKPGDPNFTVTAERPTLTDLTNIVNFLVATKASDQAKAANIEGGMSAVVVPKTVYTLGLFRPPLGWNKVTGPLVQRANTVSATLNSGSAGRPTIRMTIQFTRIDGNWRLAASSMCEGVKAVGLNIYCNR